MLFLGGFLVGLEVVGPIGGIILLIIIAAPTMNTILAVHHWVTWWQFGLLLILSALLTGSVVSKILPKDANDEILDLYINVVWMGLLAYFTTGNRFLYICFGFLASLVTVISFVAPIVYALVVRTHSIIKRSSKQKIKEMSR